MQVISLRVSNDFNMYGRFQYVFVFGTTACVVQLHKEQLSKLISLRLSITNRIQCVPVNTCDVLTIVVRISNVLFVTSF